MHTPERFPDRAIFRLIAYPVFSKAMCQNYRPIDRAHHFERADALRIARKPVSTVRSRNGRKNSRPRELLQDFREQGNGQRIAIRDVLCTGSRTGNGCEVAKSNQAVIGFLGKLEH